MFVSIRKLLVAVELDFMVAGGVDVDLLVSDVSLLVSIPVPLGPSAMSI